VSFLSSYTNTTSSTITFQVPNGTWGFTALTSDGYTASPSSGNINVNGAPASKTITFSGVGHVIGSVSFSSGTPSDVVYDNISGNMLVTLSNPGELAIVYPTNYTVAKINNLGTGIALQGIAFDWANNEVYVAETTTTGYNTAVFNATSGSWITSIALTKPPAYVAYDSAKNEAFVTMPGYGVAVIKTTTNTLTKTISLSKVQSGVVYYPKSGDILTSDSSSQISVISDSTLAVTQTLTLSGCTTPDGMGYDNSVTEIFVTCYGSSGSVAVLNATLVQVATISIGQSNPTHAVYVAGCIWVTDDQSSGEVTVIADSTSSANKVVNTIPVGNSPMGEACDYYNGYLFVANSSSDTLSVLST